MEGQARAGAHPRGDPRHRRQPLHVLGQPAGTPRRPGGGHRPRRPGGHGLPDLVTAGDVGAQGRQGRQAVPVQHRPAVQQDLRRLDLHRVVRGQVRTEEAGHGEDEHQGRVPDLDEGRRLSRDRPEGVPPVDTRGLFYFAIFCACKKIFQKSLFHTCSLNRKTKG